MELFVDPEKAYSARRALVALSAWTTLERDASGAALPHNARIGRQRTLELREVLSVLEAPWAHPKLDGRRGQELSVRDLLVCGASADGIIVEGHPDPANARSDGPQALDPQGLRALGVELGFRRERP
ncbi:MAG: hypothetical protein HY791_22715 [Deltaproteobacteria bacterium]|nr:hypothetical protein [Deltaproteobacteria bacterium]